MVCSRLDGRQTSCSGNGSPGRKLPDRLDECVKLDIIGTLMAEEPLPQPIVLAIQQPSENLAFGLGGRRPALIEPTLEQAVEFTHPTATAPAQPAQLGDVVCFAHCNGSAGDWKHDVGGLQQRRRPFQPRKQQPTAVAKTPAGWLW